MRALRSRPLPSAAALALALLPATLTTGCGPALELIDQGILLPSGSLPYAVEELPLPAQQPPPPPR